MNGNGKAASSLTSLIAAVIITKEETCTLGRLAMSPAKQTTSAGSQPGGVYHM